MITLERASWQTKRRNAEFHWLSTDTKPTEYSSNKVIDNGSEGYEIDTGKKYRFDKENQVWIEQ